MSVLSDLAEQIYDQELGFGEVGDARQVEVDMIGAWLGAHIGELNTMINTSFSREDGVPGTTASGVIVLSADGQLGNLDGESVTIGDATLTEGTNWDRSDSNDNAATGLSAAINNLNDFSSSAVGGTISISSLLVGVVGNASVSTSKPDLIAVPAALSGGVDAIPEVELVNFKEEEGAILREMYLINYYRKHGRNVLRLIDSSTDELDFQTIREGDSVITRTNKSEIAKNYRLLMVNAQTRLDKMVHAYNMYMSKPSQVTGDDAPA